MAYTTGKPKLQLEFGKKAEGIFSQLKGYHAELETIRSIPIADRTANQAALLNEFNAAQVTSKRRKLIRAGGITIGAATVAGFGIGVATAFSGAPAAAVPIAPLNAGLTVQAALPAYSEQLGAATLTKATSSVAGATKTAIAGAKAVGSVAATVQAIRSAISGTPETETNFSSGEVLTSEAEVSKDESEEMPIVISSGESAKSPIGPIVIIALAFFFMKGF
jgi:hypothetical protein